MRKAFRTHPLFLTSHKVLEIRKIQLTGVAASDEDIFILTACSIDMLLFAEDEHLEPSITDRLWRKITNDVHDWNPCVTKEVKCMLAEMVLVIVRSALCHHCESRYSYTVCEWINCTLDEKTTGIADQLSDLTEILESLIKCSKDLDKWINEYDEAAVSLSDKIESVLSNKTQPDDEEKKRTVLIDEICNNLNYKFKKNDNVDVLREHLEKNLSNKVFAAWACIIYKSPYFIKGNYNFKKWYKDFCVYVGCKHIESYAPSNLKENIDNLKKSYLYTILVTSL